jgi:methylase of polypeptide subunit release factors
MEPIPDSAAASVLGDALRHVGYTDDAIGELLDDEELENPTVAEHRLPRTPLSTAIRLFYLQLPVSRSDAGRALGRKAVDAFEAIGLAEVGDDVVPLARIIPVGALFVASDDFPKDGDEQSPGYVGAYSPTSRLCDCLTPRVRVDRALDIGTGSGVQALLAARHARRVIATDINERALAFTELNAALSGLTNVECRQGSLFEPVGEQRFGLITSNAPYVISPENRWIYRDAGFEGDELSQRVVREAAEHLRDGGYATLLVSWIAHDEDEPDERLLEWIEQTGCDAWILPIWDADPLGHAATWNDYLVDEPEALSRALDTWTQYLDGLGARHITEGAVVLHRRATRRATVRVDPIDEDEVEETGDQIVRAFAARAQLAELPRTSDLLDAKLSVSARLRLERLIKPRRRGAPRVRASLEIDEGTHSLVEGPLDALELIASLDGSLSLAELIARRDVPTTETSRLRRAVVPLARELLELGALALS